MKPYDASYFSAEICKPFFHDGGDKGIVLLHGFTGSVAHMRPLGDALHERGYTVLGINLPGHATTEKNMALTGWRDWLMAASDAIATMKKRCSIVTVCGLSMGAVLSLLMAEQGYVDGCVSISAPMPQSNTLLPLSGICFLLRPRTPWKDNPIRKKQLDTIYDKGYSGFPTRKGADLHHLIKTAMKNLQDIHCPILVVQSKDDKAVAPNSIDTIYNGVSSQQKDKLVLSDVPHVCTISKQLPAIVDSIDTLMKTL